MYIVIYVKESKETVSVCETIVNDGMELKGIDDLKGKSAREIQEICGISGMLPISFEKLWKNYKIKISGLDLSYLSSNVKEIKELIEDNGIILGMVKVKDGYANIFYNNNKNIDIPTQRFTIAHELAHCIYDGDELVYEEKVDYLIPKKRKFVNNATYNIDEENCDRFARDFLIPTESLNRICKIIPNLSVKVLADLFLVPQDEMKMKLEETGIML